MVLRQGERKRKEKKRTQQRNERFHVLESSTRCKRNPRRGCPPPSLFLTVGFIVSPKGHAESPDDRELGTKKLRAKPTPENTPDKRRRHSPVPKEPQSEGRHGLWRPWLGPERTICLMGILVRALPGLLPSSPQDFCNLAINSCKQK